MKKRVERDPQGTKGINPDIARQGILFTVADQGNKGLDRGATRDISQGAHMSPRKRNYKAKAPVRGNQAKSSYMASTASDAKEKDIWQIIAQIRQIKVTQRQDHASSLSKYNLTRIR